MNGRAVAILLVACLAAGSLLVGAAETNKPKTAFSRSTIDIGVVVSDVEKAARFYTQAVGFTEVTGFSVAADMAGDSGLTDYDPFAVRVFVLADEPSATRLKLMQIPDAKPKQMDNQYIASSLGFSYLTVHVADMKAAVERAGKAGVRPVKPPYKLDGNIVELVGPML